MIDILYEHHKILKELNTTSNPLRDKIYDDVINLSDEEDQEILPLQYNKVANSTQINTNDVIHEVGNITDHNFSQNDISNLNSKRSSAEVKSLKRFGTNFKIQTPSSVVTNDLTILNKKLTDVN